MAVEILLPRLGWTMEEGTFVEWLKKDGDAVSPGDLLYSVESDKTTNEVEAFDAGVLRILPSGPAAGARIPVGTLLGYIAQPGEALPYEAKPAAPERAPVAAAPVTTAAAAPAPAAAEPAISPRARRVAKELGVDWSALAGSGSTGRIVERDIRAAADAKFAATPKITASPVAIRAAQELGVDLDALAAQMPGKRIERADVERVAAAKVSPPAAPAAPAPAVAATGARAPMSITRRRIAERMTATLRTVAPVTLTTEADATELVKLREQLKADAAGAAVPSYNDMLARIAAKALGEHPHMNARIEGDEIVSEASAHIGLAVDTERGLLVVVVRDAQDRTLTQIAAESSRLVSRAREGKLAPEDVRGSTFSITNLGAYDIDAFTPIINLPECAILGVGRIALKPVVVGKKIRPRHRVALSLTFDHRLVDGAPAARFLQRIAQLIAQPYLWLAA